MLLGIRFHLLLAAVIKTGTEDHGRKVFMTQASFQFTSCCRKLGHMATHSTRQADKFNANVQPKKKRTHLRVYSYNVEICGSLHLYMTRHIYVQTSIFRTYLEWVLYKLKEKELF